MVERAFSTGYILEDYGDKMLIVAFWYFLRMYIYIWYHYVAYIYIVGYSNHFFRICCPENDRYIYDSLHQMDCFILHGIFCESNGTVSKSWHISRRRS
jgi:hypothetical protein